MRHDGEDCEKCGRPYSFIRAKVTLNDGRNICLECGAAEETITPAKPSSPLQPSLIPEQSQDVS